MEKKIAQKIIAILMIIMIISADFFVLGSHLVTYALLLDGTSNNKNIEFSSYFKNERGEKVDTLQTSINAENLKLYADITVKNDGYFNGILELGNNNFNIKNNIISDSVASIEENKVTLKQINAGTTVHIELEIAPLISDRLNSDMLFSTTEVKLSGKYMETSYKGLNIEAIKAVKLDLQADKNASAELITDIVTNKVFEIEGTNKKLVQLLVKSRLKDNQYPIKQTKININIPTLSEKQPEEVNVLSLGTMATNGSKILSTEEWKNENGKLEIILKNNDSEIKWNKNVYDEILVTFIYDEAVDSSKVEITTDTEITVYNTETKYTAQHIKGIENQEPNGAISIKSEISTTELYKGQLYANINTNKKKDVLYNTKSTLVITNANIAEKLVVREGLDIFNTEVEELIANTKYISTKINKAKMLEILGQEGNIEIKNENTTIVVNKDTETDDSGNIVINYTNESNELTITTTKPQNAGLLEINHSKAIIENTYTREQLKTIKAIKTKATIDGIINEENIEQKVVENKSEQSLELKETTTKAELTINKEALSTMTPNEDVILGIKLITDGVQYDLYKNPTIKIQFPSAVENIKINGTNKLYADGFAINARYDEIAKIIEISLNGEQLEYPETSAVQLYLQINMDITLAELAPSKADKIIMTYTNGNAMQYDGGTTDIGIIERNIDIISPSGLATVHNSSTFNITGISAISEEEQIVEISKADSGKEITFDIGLINNTGTDLSDVKIFGKLPTEGNKLSSEENSNTLTTTLKEILAPNSTIYYTTNNNATADINDVDNGWSTTFVENAKKYLIVLEKLSKESNYNASYTIKLPETISTDLKSYAQYDVIYDTNVNKNMKVNSVAIGIATQPSVKMETVIIAQVGNDTLKDGDIVKAGEIIKYTISVKNNGTQTIENVQLKGFVPEGTVLVEPEQDYVYTGASYYEEKTDITSKVVTIPGLDAGQTYITTYEVRAKQVKDKITNKANAICGDTVIDSEAITNKIEDSKIRITIKRTKNEDKLLAALDSTRYLLFIENLTETPVKNLRVKIEQQGIEDMYLIDSKNSTISDIAKEIQIDEVPAKGLEYFQVYGTVSKDIPESVEIYANIIDSEGNTYRSNENVQKVARVNATITMNTPNNGAYIKENDKITYEIVMKNTGNIVKDMMIVNNISEHLLVEEIYENDVLKRQSINRDDTETYFKTISNNIEYMVSPGIGEEVKVKIVASVLPKEEKFDTLRIANVSKVVISDEEIDSSEEVFHILKDDNTEKDNKPGNNSTSGNESSNGNETTGDNNETQNNKDNIGNTITGFAWLDGNHNGQKDDNEEMLANIKAQLFDISKNEVVMEINTNEEGEYIFTEISEGEYIIVFEYDTNEYEVTTYKAQDVKENLNSKVVLKSININGNDYERAVTDTIKIDKNISNINIGLREKLIYDLELEKYISKIIVQNGKETKEYGYDKSTFQKVEIHKKQIKNTVVILEYSIEVKNNGEIPGYVTNIKDYLPSGLEFKSELNPDWYLTGQGLYTKSLTNEIIKPGETKEIKLVLMKTMTEDNVGVINNRAEIVETYNEYGKQDVDSIENNENQNEDDFGKADVIIAISTGVRTILYTILTIINTALIAMAIYLVSTKKIR